ncbi:hypothetical protein DRQ33_00990 [bacterium]|nr:MAG: hypothetical protein DRQ33_00990 [bacterium]
MNKLNFTAFCLLFLFLSVNVVYPFDEPFSSQQIENILLQNLIPVIQMNDSSRLLGEASVRYALLDTSIMAITSWKFSPHSSKVWELDNLDINRISIFSPNTGKWILTESNDLIPHRTLQKISRLLLYPFSLVSKRFKGYTIKALKRTVKLESGECYKISVKPVKEDNDEEAPFYGYFYISQENDPKPVRFEYRRNSSLGTGIIRWDFKFIEEFKCYFPYKLTIMMDSQMCNFDFNSEVKLYFGILEREK